MKSAWSGIQMLFKIFTYFFAANLVFNTGIFLLNIIFGWHIPLIGIKPYIPGSPYDANARVDLDNIQDFLLFVFMFGVAFIISAGVGWGDVITKKMKAHPVVTGFCLVAVVILLIPLARFFVADNRDSRAYHLIEKGDAIVLESLLNEHRPGIEHSAYYFFAALQGPGAKEVIPVLVANGYDINALHPTAGYAPLMNAMQYSNAYLTGQVAILLTNKASPFAVDRDGKTALLYGVLPMEFSPPVDPNNNDYRELVSNIQKLLAAVPGQEKQLINQPDNAGATPLSIARERDMTEIVKLFESYR